MYNLRFSYHFSSFFQITRLCAHTHTPANIYSRPDGCVVPLGATKNTGVLNTGGYTLNYNEFVVYDPAQVTMTTTCITHTVIVMFPPPSLLLFLLLLLSSVTPPSLLPSFALPPPLLSLYPQIKMRYLVKVKFNFR